MLLVGSAVPSHSSCLVSVHDFQRDTDGDADVQTAVLVDGKNYWEVARLECRTSVAQRELRPAGNVQ